jgi:dCTP deaminase
MILSDKTIKKLLNKGGPYSITITPIGVDAAIQAASVDLHMDNKILFFPKWRVRDSILIRLPFLQGILGKLRIIDIANGDIPKMQLKEIGISGHILWPGQCILASTIERIEVPSNLAAKVEGKSSLGRIFLTAHVTAGFVDPGFCGNITLEIKNLNHLPILLRPGMKISQLCFEITDEEVEKPYGSKELGSKYQNSIGVKPARGEHGCKT